MLVFGAILGTLLLFAQVDSLYLKGENVKGDGLLHSWNNFRESIEAQPRNYPTKTDERNTKPQPFNELDALMLIPTIVELRKKDLLMPSELKLLSEIYGSIWMIMSDEVQRDEAAQMNPLLKTIYELNKLLSSTMSFQTGKPMKQLLEDVTKPLAVKKLESDPPSQRLLNLAAALIKSMKWLRLHNEQQRRTFRPLKNQERIAVFSNRKPRSAVQPMLHSTHQLNSARTKRKATKSPKRHDFPLDRVAEVLQQFVDDKGVFPQRNYDHAEDFSSPDSDYFDIAESSDYAYDDHYECDDRPDRTIVNRVNFENGSFQELLMLAARHKSGSKFIRRRTTN